MTLLLRHCHSAPKSVERNGIPIAMLCLKDEQEALILAHSKMAKGSGGSQIRQHGTSLRPLH